VLKMLYIIIKMLFLILKKKNTLTLASKIRERCLSISNCDR